MHLCNTVIFRYGIKSIFIAADSDMTISDVRKWPQFKWFYLPANSRSTEHTVLET